MQKLLGRLREQCAVHSQVRAHRRGSAAGLASALPARRRDCALQGRKRRAACRAPGAHSSLTRVQRSRRRCRVAANARSRSRARSPVSRRRLKFWSTSARTSSFRTRAALRGRRASKQELASARVVPGARCCLGRRERRALQAARHQPEPCIQSRVDASERRRVVAVARRVDKSCVVARGRERRSGNARAERADPTSAPHAAASRAVRRGELEAARRRSGQEPTNDNCNELLHGTRYRQRRRTGRSRNHARRIGREHGHDRGSARAVATSTAEWKRELYEAKPEREGELFSTISGPRERAALHARQRRGRLRARPRLSRASIRSRAASTLDVPRQALDDAPVRRLRRRPRRRTPASAISWSTARPGLSTAFDMPTLMGSTPTTRARSARSGGKASRSTRSTTWRRSSRAFRSTRCRRR